MNLASRIDKLEQLAELSGKKKETVLHVLQEGEPYQPRADADQYDNVILRVVYDSKPQPATA